MTSALGLWNEPLQNSEEGINDISMLVMVYNNVFKKKKKKNSIQKDFYVGYVLQFLAWGRPSQKKVFSAIVN